MPLESGPFGGKKYKDQGGQEDKLDYYPHDVLPYSRVALLNQVLDNPDLLVEFRKSLEQVIDLNREAVEQLQFEIDAMRLGGVEEDEDYIKVLELLIANIEDVIIASESELADNPYIYFDDDIESPVTQWATYSGEAVPGLGTLVKEVERVYREDESIVENIPLAISVSKLVFDTEFNIKDFLFAVHIVKSEAPFNYLDAHGKEFIAGMNPEFKSGQLWLSIGGHREYYWDAAAKRFMKRYDIEDDTGDEGDIFA